MFHFIFDLSDEQESRSKVIYVYIPKKRQKKIFSVRMNEPKKPFSNKTSKETESLFYKQTR